MSGYGARHTRLHPALWNPYQITAYPAGFLPGMLGGTAPVWEPRANVIAHGSACSQLLGDAASLDEAIGLCWAHYGQLHAQVTA